ncbi:MAG: hypothetical protein ACRCXT_00695 [Paraclostridium sp.]
MAEYTLELRSLNREPSKVFNFEYDFYNDNNRDNFEQKFIDHYFFHEIGFETVQRFKHCLKTKLNEIMPYYTQLYQTELRTQGIDFMLNKDLKETLTKELNRTNNTTNTSVNKGTSNQNTTSNDVNNFKESSVNNGNASLNDNSLTSISKSDSNSNNNSTDNTTINIDNNINSNDVETETETRVSQGNIGITSSADLLQKWRETIINIDKQIIDECNDLFMQIF